MSLSKFVHIEWNPFNGYVTARESEQLRNWVWISTAIIRYLWWKFYVKIYVFVLANENPNKIFVSLNKKTLPRSQWENVCSENNRHMSWRGSYSYCRCCSFVMNWTWSAHVSIATETDAYSQLYRMMPLGALTIVSNTLHNAPTEREGWKEWCMYELEHNFMNEMTSLELRLGQGIVRILHTMENIQISWRTHTHACSHGNGKQCVADTVAL